MDKMRKYFNFVGFSLVLILVGINEFFLEAGSSFKLIVSILILIIGLSLIIKNSNVITKKNPTTKGRNK